MKETEEFIYDVRKHEMEIIKDDGVYRHIDFRNPDDSNRNFQLTTWPGYLCISGDMGCYTFRRLHDMFEFFSVIDGKLGVNQGYWGEKLVSISQFGIKDGNISLFSPQETLESLEDSGIFKDLDKDEAEQFKDEILDCEDEGEAVDIMYRRGLSDVWEYLESTPSPYVVWILHAIAWGIMQYKNTSQQIKVNNDR